MGEAAHERAVGIADQRLPGAQGDDAVLVVEKRLAEHRQIHGDRVGRALADHLGRPLDDVGGAADPGEM